jgi:putative flippase GtrA
VSEYLLNDRWVFNAGDRFVGTAARVSILRKCQVICAGPVLLELSRSDIPHK